ncbi:acetyl/propionyl/methylcrotonyl-CoA carboxylase subunit alpha [Mesobacillus zeae]|uniref:Acetyl-CoA carboxylase biotin carboxylase subunit n=1 Tax=Mesobacillus zeae TaxID=1917180 RepID=A0A398BKF4_9BACI|nr:acetyl-CoA carboxylase biotin carboxylase subunit [Mesobacillus zeae]RID87896.1 acetyl-CoA carboxylase biotin carboxylase subunit [Mesobacillus zeae]
MQRILIANRGEIALRIIRTCRAMGIETIAVFSDADKDLPYVKEADTAFRIGEPPVQKSYLNSSMLIEIAKREKADAIHPGYGFLSENAGFAREVIENGLIFIGPSPKTIEAMGDKIIARKTMEKAGVPVVPGSGGGVSSLEEAVLLAGEIGYPVMLKASGGGGGIGMVRCENEQALNSQYQSTKARAKAYFGSEDVFIEKYIADARHIEVQIFGDSEGNAVHLFERDCSIQRRHQKVVEEAPSPSLSAEARENLYRTALSAAKAVDYVNAGTVEFIVDSEENFYFLEMNTRLQVEHPVTEVITGLDLVEWQILVAQGDKLPLTQEEITRKGAAVEFRLYAEDPVSFFPSPGTLSEFRWEADDVVRIDTGYREGNAVTPFYDPMIAKIIVSGDDRNEAIASARQFFQGLKIEGLKSNAPVFRELLHEEAFLSGKYSTSYLNSVKKAAK